MSLALIRLITDHQTYIACFLVAALITWAATPWVMKFARRIGAVDKPKRGKIHKEPTPLLGGLGVFVGIWVPIALLSFWDNFVTQSMVGQWWQFGAVLGASGAMMLLGIYDDTKGMSARAKLLVQLPVAIVFAVWIGRFESISLPGIEFDLSAWSIPLTVLWIVGVTNAVNLIDGIDGLAAGVSMFVSLTTATIALLSGNAWLALLMFSTAGACAGVLRYNFAPARIFLGDTGSLALGMLLATSSVLANAKGPVAASMLSAAIVLGYPIADTLLAMVRRKLHGKPMFAGDVGHIHHRLVATGMGHRRAALVIYGVCALLSLLGIALVTGDNAAVALSLLVVSAVMVLGLWFIDFFKPFLPRTIADRRPLYQVAYHLTGLLKARMRLARREHEVLRLLEDGCRELRLRDAELVLRRPGRPERVLHAWGETGHFDVDYDVATLNFREYDLRGRLHSTSQPAELMIEYQQRILQLLEAAAVRLERVRPDSIEIPAADVARVVAPDDMDSDSRRSVAVDALPADADAAASASDSEAAFIRPDEGDRAPGV